jgi:hypothetical protein
MIIFAKIVFLAMDVRSSDTDHLITLPLETWVSSGTLK